MKKKLLTAAALVMAAITLVATTAFITYAILADSASVTNSFTVGSVTIEMFETKVDEDGKPIEPKEEVDKNSYHLIPNSTYTKDPTIRITTTNASDEMYLFVKSTNQIRDIESGNVDADSTKLTMRQQMEKNGWVEFIQSEDKRDIVWVYGTRAENGVITPIPVNCDYVQKLGDGTDNAKGEFRLCEEFTVGNVDAATVNIYGAAVVQFNAFAIQTTHVDSNDANELAKVSWDAIKNAFPYEGGIFNPINPYDNSKSGDAAYLPVPKSDTVSEG